MLVRVESVVTTNAVRYKVVQKCTRIAALIWLIVGQYGHLRFLRESVMLCGRERRTDCLAQAS